MKKIYILIITILLINTASNAQQPLQAVLVGDTVVLTVNGANGTIQWQESTDSIVWTSISGATTNIYEQIAGYSTTGKRFYRAEVSNTTICANANWYSSVIRCKIINSTTEIEIGDWYMGGIVFYIDGSGHGLIAPQQDQSIAIIEWGCAPYGNGTATGATSTIDGMANTATILATCTQKPIAASICDSLTLNGYNDWFLPAKAQLNYLYLQKNIVGAFTGSNYWSSSEYDDDKAWFQYFYDGGQYTHTKNYNHIIRCIRFF